jgi:CubicO group peptidase (beta-lactamase class C family)
MRMSIHPAVALGAALIGCSLWLWLRSTHQMAHDLDVYMRRQVQNSHFSGVVLVSHAGEVLFEDGYGLADVEWGILNRTNTKFPVASLSKQFTAVLIMKLQEQGKLHVTDLICRYLDSCPAIWSSIRISHLLSHTSGIPDFTDIPSFLAERRLSRTKGQVVLTFRDKPLEFAPGEKFRYSNSNYFLLGMIIEKVSGSTFETVLTREILTPLRLKDTGIADGNSIIEKQARGYRATSQGRVVDADVMDSSWTFGAGAIYSTVGDLKRWDDALYTDAILPRSTLVSMWTPVKEGYGYGWYVPATSHATLDRHVVFHSGHTDGFVSCMSRFPDDELVVIVLSNYEMTKHACSVATGLAAITLGNKDALRQDPIEVHLDPLIESRYVGNYRVSSDINVHIALENGHLFATIGQIPKAEIFPASEHEFFFKVFDTQLDFVTDSAGKVTGFIAHIPLRDDVPGEKLD